MCWRLVIRNRRRYKAVLVGIAFGTAGFIVVQTMGDSVEQKISQNLEILGGATIISAEWDDEEEHHPGHFSMADVYRLKKIPNVVAVAPEVSLPGTIVNYINTKYALSLIGVDQAYWRTKTAYASEGRLIGPSDVVARNKVCVLGSNSAKFLFNDENPVGKSVQVINLTFTVIGVLGGVQPTDMLNGIIVPITTAQNLFPALYKIRQIYLRVDDWNSVDKARDTAYAVLKVSHKGYDHALRVIHHPERIKLVKTLVSVVKLFVYASIIVTIGLGGIGISNVMLAAVRDRTKEIGLRKALGAKQETILLQFLTEATFIGIMAGLLGITAGVTGVLSA